MLRRRADTLSGRSDQVEVQVRRLGARPDGPGAAGWGGDGANGSLLGALASGRSMTDIAAAARGV